MNPISRKFYRTVFGFEDRVISPFNSTLDVLEQAVVERAKLVKGPDGVFTTPPRPKPGYTFKRFLGAYGAWAKPSNRMSTSEFIASRPSCKRRLYTNAYKQSRQEWLDIQKRSTTKFFIKVEKTEQQHTNYFTGVTTKKPVPRLINPRDPRYNIELGRYTCKVEHEIYDNIGKMFGRPAIAKGMNYWERAEVIRGHWDQFDDPVFKVCFVTCWSNLLASPPMNTGSSN